MANTNRLILPLPTSLESMAEGDNLLSNFYDTVDANMHCRIVANQAAVTTPFEGQHIRSTADGKNYLRKNNAWEEFTAQSSSSNSVIGFKATAVTTTMVPLSAAAWTHCMSVNFVAISGHRYLFVAAPSLIIDAVANIRYVWRILSAPGLSTTGASDIDLEQSQEGNRINRPCLGVAQRVPAVSGNYTASIYAQILSGSTAEIKFCLNSTTSRITVYDMNYV